MQALHRLPDPVSGSNSMSSPSGKYSLQNEFNGLGGVFPVDVGVFYEETLVAFVEIDGEFHYKFEGQTEDNDGWSSGEPKDTSRWGGAMQLRRKDRLKEFCYRAKYPRVPLFRVRTDQCHQLGFGAVGQALATWINAHVVEEAAGGPGAAGVGAGAAAAAAAAARAASKAGNLGSQPKLAKPKRAPAAASTSSVVSASVSDPDRADGDQASVSAVPLAARASKPKTKSYSPSSASTAAASSVGVSKAGTSTRAKESKSKVAVRDAADDLGGKNE